MIAPNKIFLIQNDSPYTEFTGKWEILRTKDINDEYVKRELVIEAIRMALFNKEKYITPTDIYNQAIKGIQDEV